MILKKYNLELHRMVQSDIEMIRSWRNDPKIQQHMFFKQTITAEMQQNWFKKIDTIHNFYFKIVYQNKAVGLIHVSDIDFKKRDAFSGLFIYDDNYLSTDVPARASLCMLDYFFEEDILYTLYAKTKKDNAIAIKYNQSLGFEIAGDIEDESGYLLRLTRENYLHKCQPFKTFFGKSGMEVEYDNSISVDALWQEKLNA